MRNGWIKLHSKVVENDIWRYDQTAWHIFEYLLMSCDYKTGKVNKAHSTMSEFLGIPKSTLSKALDRLESASMVNRKRNTFYTTYSICNWRKYQTTTEQLTEQQRNPDGTATEHIKEVKNKELNTTNVVFGKPEINELFEYWDLKTGLPIKSRVTANRRSASTLFNQLGKDKLHQLIDGVVLAQEDKYAPRISDFTDLQSKMNALLVWGKQRNQNNKVGVVR